MVDTVIAGIYIHMLALNHKVAKLKHSNNVYRIYIENKPGEADKRKYRFFFLAPKGMYDNHSYSTHFLSNPRKKES
jgi:hypothetical protein